MGTLSACDCSISLTRSRVPGNGLGTRERHLSNDKVSSECLCEDALPRCAIRWLVTRLLCRIGAATFFEAPRLSAAIIWIGDAFSFGPRAAGVVPTAILGAFVTSGKLTSCETVAAIVVLRVAFAASGFAVVCAGLLRFCLGSIQFFVILLKGRRSCWCR